MQLMKTVTGLSLAIALMAGSGAAQDETSNNAVAEKTDWTVFVEDNPKECWAVSMPQSSVNTRDGREVSVSRGQILLMVFYRPGTDAVGQVAFTGGYPFREGSQVSLVISDDTFTLFSEGEWAWPSTPADDAKVVEAMKRGVNAVLSGVSSRGTTTKDTFSLLGFTAAVEDAGKRCAN